MKAQTKLRKGNYARVVYNAFDLERKAIPLRVGEVFQTALVHVHYVEHDTAYVSGGWAVPLAALKKVQVNRG